MDDETWTLKAPNVSPSTVNATVGIAEAN